MRASKQKDRTKEQMKGVLGTVGQENGNGEKKKKRREMMDFCCMCRLPGTEEEDKIIYFPATFYNTRMGDNNC